MVRTLFLPWILIWVRSPAVTCFRFLSNTNFWENGVIFLYNCRSEFVRATSEFVRATLYSPLIHFMLLLLNYAHYIFQGTYPATADDVAPYGWALASTEPYMLFVILSYQIVLLLSPQISINDPSEAYNKQLIETDVTVHWGYVSRILNEFCQNFGSIFLH